MIFPLRHFVLKNKTFFKKGIDKILVALYNISVVSRR